MKKAPGRHDQAVNVPVGELTKEEEVEALKAGFRAMHGQQLYVKYAQGLIPVHHRPYADQVLREQYIAPPALIRA